MKFGSKWYFKGGESSRFGFQAIWLRSGLYSADDRKIIETFPLNIGLTSIWILNEKIALEANLNTGLHIHHFILKGDDPDGIAEIAINPNIKLRYNKLAFGIDITNTLIPFETDPYKSNIFIFSVTAGIKF